MKRFTLCLAIIAIGTLTANAQDGERIFKRFKGDVSLGYAKPVSSGSSGGVLFAMEPKFAIIDQLAVGLRIEGAVMARFTGSTINGEAEVEDAKGSASYVATADYYFTNNYNIRPFVGGGVGFFGLVSDATLNNYDEPAAKIKFGGLLRVGAEVKHFRFGLEYNIIPETDVNSTDDLGNAIKVKSKNGYFGVKFGFCFGGGPL